MFYLLPLDCPPTTTPRNERELIALCAEAHIAPPDGLADCVAAVGALPEAAAAAAAPAMGAAATDLLARLAAMLGEARAAAAKRAALLAAIGALEEAAAEDAWLRDAFEADGARYKGRDASRRLQRALRAQRLREKLPELAAAARAGLEAWRAAEGGAPFLYDGRDYCAALEAVEGRLEADAADRAARAQARRQQAQTPPSSGGRARASPLGGTGSPQVVSGRQLRERHSIAVFVGGAPGAGQQGGTMTGRQQAAAMRASGQIALRGSRGAAAAAAVTPLASHRTPAASKPPRTPVPALAPPSTAEGGAKAAVPAPASERLAAIFARPTPLRGAAPLAPANGAGVTPPAAASPRSLDARALRRGGGDGGGCDQDPPSPAVPADGAAGKGDGAAARCDLSAAFDRLLAQTGGGDGGAKAAPAARGASAAAMP